MKTEAVNMTEKKGCSSDPVPLGIGKLLSVCYAAVFLVRFVFFLIKRNSDLDSL